MTLGDELSLTSRRDTVGFEGFLCLRQGLPLKPCCPGTVYVAQAGLSLQILLPLPPPAGIEGLCHCAQESLILVFNSGSRRVISVQCLTLCSPCPARPDPVASSVALGIFNCGHVGHPHTTERLSSCIKFSNVTGYSIVKLTIVIKMVDIGRFGSK